METQKLLIDLPKMSDEAAQGLRRAIAAMIAERSETPHDEILKGIELFKTSDKLESFDEDRMIPCAFADIVVSKKR